MSVRKRNRCGGLDPEIESLFRLFSDADCEPSDVGRRQFVAMESRGVRPIDPDPFYKALMSGKRQFNILQSSIKETYLTDEWIGWYAYWNDWTGQRWVLRHLMAFCPNLPEWLTQEGDNPTNLVALSEPELKAVGNRINSSVDTMSDSEVAKTFIDLFCATTVPLSVMRSAIKNYAAIRARAMLWWTC